MRRLALLLLPAMSLLAGCIAPGPYPSLAMRPDENEPMTEPVRTPPVVAADPALARRLAALVAAARQGDARFDEAYGPTERLARAAGATGSDSWVEAQQALSRLEASRGGTTDAAAEIDQLGRVRSDQPTSADDQAAIRRALDEANMIAAAQLVRIRHLQALLDR